MVGVYGIFGDPIEHSLSPLMHNIAFKALDMNCVYLPFRVKQSELSGAVEAIRALNMGGVNITIPHKEAVAQYLDHIEGDALLTGSINTIVNKDGVLYGYSTDGDGLLLSLRKESGFFPQNKKILILGAGGVARAVAFSLIREGVAELSFVNRTLERGESLAEDIKGRTGFKVQCFGYKDSGLNDLIKQLNLVINCTPLGMYPHTNAMPPFPLEECNPECLICDLIYRPLETVFLKEAKKHGLKTLGGLGMLLYQGLLAFTHWTGVEPPETPMRLVLEKFFESGES